MNKKNEIGLEFPNAFPYIIDDYNNLSTYKFQSPKIIDSNSIKSIFRSRRCKTTVKLPEI